RRPRAEDPGPELGRREPRRVLRVVVAPVLARLDRLPPGAVVAVPLDGLREAFLEAPLGLPAELAQLRGVERVAAIVPGAILDVADQRGVGARELEDALGDVQVLALLAADVVDLARRSLLEHQLDGGAVVACVEPLAPLAAVAVDRERQSVERVRDEEGHELLRVLALAVGIGAARDAGVETVGA